MAFWRDLLGNIVSSKAIREPQTAQAVTLRREFASHPSRGLTPARLAAILDEAERGNLIAQAELFQDMEEKDGHIQAEMHKRKMAVTQLDWRLQPVNDASAREKKAAAALEARIRDMLDVEDMLFDCLDGIGHGYACLELEWGKDAEGWFPNVCYREPTWFTVDPEQRNTLRLRDNAHIYGVELIPFGWIIHLHKSRSGYLARGGLHRSLAWPYLFKNYSVRDLAELLEIYGLPIRVGKYPSGATDAEKISLMNAVMSIGHNAGGIISDSMMMDFITATSAGSSDPFKAMIDWCEATQSKAIVGATLTSQTGANGNRALGEVHNEVRLDIRNSDARQLGITLSRYLVYPLCMVNGLAAENRCPNWVFDTQEPDDLGLYSDAIPKLVNIGFKVPSRYLYDKLKVPQPEDGEEVLAVNTPPQAPVDKGGNPSAAAAALSTPSPQPFPNEGEGDNDPSPVTAYTDRLADDAQAALKTMVERIRERVNNAQSLESLRDDILAMYGDLPSDELAAAMGVAFAVADLAGRWDVGNGDGNGSLGVE